MVVVSEMSHGNIDLAGAIRILFESLSTESRMMH